MIVAAARAGVLQDLVAQTIAPTLKLLTLMVEHDRGVWTCDCSS
jgi:hypothetical protein